MSDTGRPQNLGEIGLFYSSNFILLILFCEALWKFIFLPFFEPHFPIFKMRIIVFASKIVRIHELIQANDENEDEDGDDMINSHFLSSKNVVKEINEWVIGERKWFFL